MPKARDPNEDLTFTSLLGSDKPGIEALEQRHDAASTGGIFFSGAIAADVSQRSLLATWAVPLMCFGLAFIGVVGSIDATTFVS